MKNYIQCFFIFICLTAVNQWVLAAEYTVVVRAKRGMEMAMQQWQATIDTLSERSGHRFTLKPVLSLPKITEIAVNKQADFILTNPSSYVEISQLTKAKALVTLNNRRANTAQAKFGTVIFTHAKNTDILSIHGLENKRLIAVSEPAFGGWRVAWLEMLNQGFDPYKKLKTILFTKSRTQQEVVYSVLEGKADVGVVRTDLLERMEEGGKIDMRYLRVINNKDVKGFPFFLSTQLYPEWPFAALTHVPDNDAERVKQILLQIKSSDKAAIAGKYIGWIESSNYNSVQNLMRRLKVGPYKNK